MSVPTLTDMAAAISAEHLAVVETGRVAVKHAINCGKLLIEAKAKFQHGDWMPWVEANCQISQRTAQVYMRLARKMEGLPPSKTQYAADLTIRQVLEKLSHKKQSVMIAAPAEPKPNMATLQLGPAPEPTPDRDAIDVDFDLVGERDGEVVERKPEPIVSQEITRPDDPEPDMFFKEDDEKLRQRRNMWRIRYQEVLNDALTLEDVKWALEMLQWRIRNGVRP